MESNDDQKYYNYPISKFLDKDLTILDDVSEYAKIFLCVYKIDTHGKYPFIQYILSNNSGYDKLSIPFMLNYNSLNNENLLLYVKVFLSGILKINDFEEFNEKSEFNGFREFQENLYLFFDISRYDCHVDDTYSSSYARFTLLDEIINHRNVCGIPICMETTKFFVKNDILNYLYDINGNTYDNPIVGYVGKPTLQKLNFVSIFGESAKNKSAILGPYYYFTDFNSAIRQGGWSHNYKPEYLNDRLITDNDNGRYLSGGIVRFALFTGKIKHIENMPNDEIDNSEIKKERLKDPELNEKYEIATLRISDHDGLWSKKYDSVYLGDIELDDGSFVEDTPMLVLKEYNQQFPLSYHYIDKKKLGVKFDPDTNNYGIV